MELKCFLKDKGLFICITLLAATFSSFLLYMVNSSIYFILFVPSSYMVGCVIILTIEFITKNKYYSELFSTLECLDKKTLLSEIVPESNFYEGKMLSRALKETNKSMNDEIAKHSLSTAQYREYIELWVHEIKTPIAGAKLICENKKIIEINNEMERIEKLVEQALFYCRSGSVERDYIIKEIQLKEIVSGVLRKNARQFIEQKIRIEMDYLEETVYTDIKWVDFMLSQILDNAVKYGSSKIKIYSVQNPNGLSLRIEDNGIGIEMKDVHRVFEKGFTGESGRIYGKSTGIGLYLCKKLCDKLGLHIFLTSQKEKGTNVEIVFPKSNMYLK